MITDKYPTPSKRGWGENSHTWEGPCCLHTGSLCWWHLGFSSWGFWAVQEGREVSWRGEGNLQITLAAWRRKVPSPQNGYEFQTQSSSDKIWKQAERRNKNKVSPAPHFPDSIPHHPWLLSPFGSIHLFQHNGTARDGAGKNTHPSLAHSLVWDVSLNPWGKEAMDPGARRSRSWLTRWLLHAKGST